MRSFLTRAIDGGDLHRNAARGSDSEQATRAAEDNHVIPAPCAGFPVTTPQSAEVHDRLWRPAGCLDLHDFIFEGIGYPAAVWGPEG